MIIKTGIFWFVRGEIIADRYDYIFEEQKQGDFIDYPHSHFAMWDKLSKNRFPYADFATYPRGRLLFDVKATNTTAATSVANFNNLPNPGKTVLQPPLDEKSARARQLEERRVASIAESNNQANFRARSLWRHCTPTDAPKKAIKELN